MYDKGTYFGAKWIITCILWNASRNDVPCPEDKRVTFLHNVVFVRIALSFSLDLVSAEKYAKNDMKCICPHGLYRATYISLATSFYWHYVGLHASTLEIDLHGHGEHYEYGFLMKAIWFHYLSIAISR